MVKVLTGWKEIATTLGVSVKTAQNYRAQRGLPVFNMSPRLVGVRATDLDAWMMFSRRDEGADGA